MHDPILTRRSIRAFTEDAVPDDQVERLLRAAMAAPSAGNQQPWRFVLVTDRDTMRAITTFHPYARMLERTPLAVVVCGATEGLRWPQFWEQDCAAACENLLIEAETIGLGAVWLGVHPLEERVAGLRALLGVPEGVVPFAVVAVGRPAESKRPADRYKPEHVRRERW